MLPFPRVVRSNMMCVNFNESRRARHSKRRASGVGGDPRAVDHARAVASAARTLDLENTTRLYNAGSSKHTRTSARGRAGAAVGVALPRAAQPRLSRHSSTESSASVHLWSGPLVLRPPPGAPTTRPRPAALPPHRLHAQGGGGAGGGCLHWTPTPENILPLCSSICLLVSCSPGWSPSGVIFSRRTRSAQRPARAAGSRATRGRCRR